MSSFLECNIWSLYPDNRTNDEYWFIEKVYQFNSDNSEFNRDVNIRTLQIPEFCIRNLYLLEEIDLYFARDNQIPVIRGCGDDWTVELTHYEKAYTELQPECS